eukprot:SM000089S23846  [mRNA]  locus=s89:345175:347169:- [translate_table: standard]
MASIAEVPLYVVAARAQDPENILAAPQPGHIGRRVFQKRAAQDEAFRKQAEADAAAERERRAAARAAREVPTSTDGLIEFFLATEAQEFEYEVARNRRRLTEEFFEQLGREIGELRFATQRSPQTEDRLVELQALEKVLKEGMESHDRMTSNFVVAKDRLAKILASENKKATLLEMAGQNEIDRNLLALLDQNIADASDAGQAQAAEFMGKIRGALLKFITV